eukprot:ANDGO_04239.mRNA.1 hypothetical protein
MTASLPDDFALNVRYILSNWTALTLCISYHDSPSYALEVRADLCNTILSWFSHGEIFQEELEQLLHDVMSEDLDTQLEDGSIPQVSALIRECYLRPRLLAPMDEMQRVIAAAENISGFRRQWDDSDSNDDDDDDDGAGVEDGSEGPGSDGHHIIQAPQDNADQDRGEDGDDDGWTTVGAKKKKGKGSSSRMDLD